MANVRTIGLIGAGVMGAGLGALFVKNDLRVISPLAGRSADSLRRAADAGIQDADLAELLKADLLLSVVPPAQAVAVARGIASAAQGEALPVFIDANAVSPDTKRQLEAIVTTAHGTFLDGVIIGGPPADGYAGPRLYVSGEHTGRTGILQDAGLDVRVLEGPVGTAAALKMCYGGLNKGITALTTAALLAARRSGADGPLIAELGISQQALLERSRSSVPHMYPKAYRWVAEFEEIATFSAQDDAISRIFAAIATFYEDRAEAFDNNTELAELRLLLGAPKESRKR